MKFNVTFRCALPIDFEKHPEGEELAHYLVAKFRERGLSMQLIDNYEDFAWWLAFDKYGSSPWLLAGYVGDDIYQWLVQINSGVSWLGRLLGRSDKDLRESVATHLHDILSRDAYFSDIRWHEGHFGTEHWSATPLTTN